MSKKLRPKSIGIAVTTVVALIALAFFIGIPNFKNDVGDGSGRSGSSSGGWGDKKKIRFSGSW
jgi:hypothetical protein